MHIRLEDRTPRPAPPTPQRKEEGEGPTRPDVKRPDNSDLLRRMRRVDPEAARRYRQRSGQ
jgi:hypothetical protein